MHDDSIDDEFEFPERPDDEDLTPSYVRCPACGGRGVQSPRDDLYCARCEGDGRIHILDR